MIRQRSHGHAGRIERSRKQELVVARVRVGIERGDLEIVVWDERGLELEALDRRLRGIDCQHDRRPWYRSEADDVVFLYVLVPAVIQVEVGAARHAEDFPVVLGADLDVAQELGLEFQKVRVHPGRAAVEAAALIASTVCGIEQGIVARLIVGAHIPGRSVERCGVDVGAVHGCRDRILARRVTRCGLLHARYGFCDLVVPGVAAAAGEAQSAHPFGCVERHVSVRGHRIAAVAQVINFGAAERVGATTTAEHVALNFGITALIIVFVIEADDPVEHPIAVLAQDLEFLGDLTRVLFPGTRVGDFEERNSRSVVIERRLRFVAEVTEDVADAQMLEHVVLRVVGQAPGVSLVE